MENILSFKLESDDILLAESEEKKYSISTSELKDYLDFKGSLEEVYDFYDPMENKGHKQVVTKYVDIFDWLKNQTEDEICDTLSIFVEIKKQTDVFERLGNILNPNYV